MHWASSQLENGKQTEAAKHEPITAEPTAELRSNVCTTSAHGQIPPAPHRILEADTAAAAHIGADETLAAARAATGKRTGQALSHRIPGRCWGEAGAWHRTPRTHHKAVNCCTAASGDTTRPAPVSHWPQAPTSSCTGRLARSQSIWIADAIPATTLAAMAGANGGCSTVASSAACHRLCSSCSLKRIHSSTA